jgi:hypothetical protein
MATKSRVGEILVKAKLLDDLQLRAAQAQHDQWGGRIGKVVADMGFAHEDAIADAIAKALFLRRTQLGNIPKDQVALSKIDAAYAERNAVFPVGMRDNGKTLLLAMADPTDLQVFDEVAMKARCRVITVVAGEKEIEAAIMRHYKGLEPDVASMQHSPIERVNHGLYHRSDSADLDSNGDEEFKVVDMSGNTVSRRMVDIEAEGAAQKAAKAARAVREQNATSSARDMLEEILSGPKVEATLSPEVVQRLETLRSNQDKSTRILSALMELLHEKGAVSREEMQARSKG